MKEDNPHLSYQSLTDNTAHMCGHDGHTTCMLGGIAKIIESAGEIPSNKIIKVLF